MLTETEKPIRVFYGSITGTFYATQHYTETIENGERHFRCTGKKYDVTQDIANIIVHEEIEFVPDEREDTDAD